MADVAKVALELDNRAIVMSRAELEKLAVSGTVAGEKIKAALAGVTPIAQTVADRAKQVHATFTQFEQTQAPINRVSDAILRMRQTLNQVRADAQASQLAIADPFQKGEIAVNRVTAAMQRMQIAARQAQAGAMASQIGALDPFQSGGAGAGGGAARATTSIASFNRVAGQAALAMGGLSARTLILANALGNAAEKFAAIRAAQVATAAATGSTVTVMGTLRATLASINPLILAAVAGYAAYAITTKLLGDNTDELVESFERSGEAADRATAALRRFNDMQADLARQTARARSELEAFRRGGQTGLTGQQDFNRAVELVREWLVARGELSERSQAFDAVAHASFDRLFAGASRLVQTERLLALSIDKTTEATKRAADEQERRTRIANAAAERQLAQQRQFLIPGGSAGLFGIFIDLDALKRANEQLAITETRVERISRLSAEAAQRRQAQQRLFNVGNVGGFGVGPIVFDLDAFKIKEQSEQAAERLQTAFQTAFQNIAARGKASFGDLFNFIASASPAGSGLAIGFSAAANFADAVFGSASRAAEARRRFEEEVNSWNQTLDDWVTSLRNTGDDFGQQLADIEQRFREQMEALDRIRSQGIDVDLFSTETGERIERYADEEERLNQWRKEAIATLERLQEAERVRTRMSLEAELARAQGNDAEALRIERQLRLSEASEKFEQVLLKQIFAAQDAAAANAKLTESMESAKRIAEDLADFQNRLKLGSLSPLSPVAQLAEARRQFETMAALALGGDRSAAASLSGSSEAFLQASRGVNASSAGFVSDFNRVQAVIDAVRGRLGTEISDAQAQLRLSEKHIDIARDGVRIAADQRDLLSTQLKVLSDGFTALRDELLEIRASTDEQTRAIERNQEMAGAR
jgi:hypothetical protein